VSWDGGVTRHFRRNVRKTARVLYGLHVFNAIGGYGSRRDCGCLFGFPSYMIALVVERTEKGGVGGSTSSLATKRPENQSFTFCV